LNSESTTSTHDTNSTEQSSYRHIWIEVGAVLVLVGGSSLATAACRLFWPDHFQWLDRRLDEAEFRNWVAFAIGSLQQMVYAIQFVPIMLFIIWRSGEPWSRFGLVRPAWEKDILLGLALYLVVALLRVVIRAPWSELHRTPLYFLPASTPAPRLPLLLASCCAVGFSDELIGNGYIIARFELLTGSTWKALLVSIVFSAFLHLHKSGWGILYSALSAFVWGIAFCVTRRIWPVAIAHAVNDFVVDTHLSALIDIRTPY
jgi:membrane protease YdiL (CAAX protease family)